MKTFNKLAKQPLANVNKVKQKMGILPPEETPGSPKAQSSERLGAEASEFDDEQPEEIQKFEEAVRQDLLKDCSDEQKSSCGLLIACLAVPLATDPINKVWVKKFVTKTASKLSVPVGASSTFESALAGNENATTHATMLMSAPIEQRGCLVKDLIVQAILSGGYDARARTLARRLAAVLDVPWEAIEEFEVAFAHRLSAPPEETDEERVEREAREAKKSQMRMLKIGGAAIGGAVLIGVTGGLSAPLVAAGMGALIGTTAAGFLATTAGLLLVTSIFGATGAGFGAYSMNNRVGQVEEFAFERVVVTEGDALEPPAAVAAQAEASGSDEGTDKLMAISLVVSGWLRGDPHTFRYGDCWVGHIPGAGEEWALRWESDILWHLNKAMTNFIKEQAVTQIGGAVLRQTVLAAVMSAAALPATLLSLGKLIDNPWANAQSRATDAGLMLADVLCARQQGSRPVSLYGYSLGARVIQSCLLELSRRGESGRGLVETAYLIGAPVPASQGDWTTMRNVVSGTIVNAHDKDDWLLRFIYRAMSGETSVAGLEAMDVPGIRNVDLSGAIENLKQSSLIDAVPDVMRVIAAVSPADPLAPALPYTGDVIVLNGDDDVDDGADAGEAPAVRADDTPPTRRPAPLNE